MAKPKFRRRRRRQGGFTLIEIMVVVLIIGLLVGLVGTNVFQALVKGKKGTARTQIRQLEGAVDMYRTYNNRLPDSLEELTEPDEDTGEPYIKRVPLDPWDHEYEYIVNNDGSFEIVSYGRDGAPGGTGEDEDLSSADLE